MVDIFRKLAQLDKRTKRIILLAIVLIIITIIIVSIVDNRQKQVIVNEITERSTEFEPVRQDDPLSSPLRQLLGGSSDTATGISLVNTDVEVISRSGDWIAVQVISLRMSNYGNQFYVIYYHNNNNYYTVASGTLFNRADFDGYEIPDSIFNDINNHSAQRNDSRLQSILENSPDKTYPIINSLPIGNEFYQITYSFEDESEVNSFYLYVDATNGYNNAAINNLINAGFDPGDYKIIFKYDLLGQLGGNNE